jgi:UDP-galactopyranose mutase
MNINTPEFNSTLRPLRTNELADRGTLICFSHLRWDFVFQRPQQLLTRFAKNLKILFIEEPIFQGECDDHLTSKVYIEGITVIVPVINERKQEQERNASLRNLMALALKDIDISESIFWYYNPMAFSFTAQYQPKLVIYDCMDELSAFKFAPANISSYEEQLMKKADIMFTGGKSLFNAKKDKHPNIYAFPSSIDKTHFGSAREITAQPADQVEINSIKLGFFGVIDERFDIELIREAASIKTDWHFVLIGPVVKIDPATLPQASNIHYMGSKSYQELPAYISGWDIALIPFQLNESTRYISPTKTPEYLAAGVPVISTPIKDVINPYGVNGLVRIAGNAAGLIREAADILSQTDTERKKWLTQVDEFLTPDSWDNTCQQMMNIIQKKYTTSQNLKTQSHV